jgi:hypothetical protein
VGFGAISRCPHEKWVCFIVLNLKVMMWNPPPHGAFIDSDLDFKKTELSVYVIDLNRTLMNVPEKGLKRS